ncbi:TolC family protein [Azohydromonas lata]|uniref:TolC family protein n=1 Tax=Azohydromonas lata TaxID=45677 RepID=A0ABU5IN47_9BURK|nr:TolC family protein [Azohydromonas lata]MDZ5460317.1 TolC family protein [Azohydromonas lata]
MKRSLQISVLFLAAGVVSVAQAQTFAESVQAARRADAQFSAALAAAQSRRATSRQSAGAFYPVASVNYNSADPNYGGRNSRTIALQQPILSYDRYLTLQQSDPLAALADAEEAQAENEMTLRVFAAMADIVRNREQIRALGVQIEGLEEQLRRATRMRELGQGTVTEVSDFQVRVAAAQANRVNLRNALQAAERSYTLLTGLRANVAALQVDVPAWADPREADAVVAQVRDDSPQSRVARLNVRLAEIAAKRVPAQYMPQVAAQLASTQVPGYTQTNTSRVAVTLTAPLGSSPYYDYQRAAADLAKAQDSLRFAQDTQANEATRLLSAIRSYGDEVQIRRQAVEIARQSVEANIKSYQGGVKTNIDVISSYQAQADAEVALVNSLVSQSEAWLRLTLLTRTQPAAL